MPIRDMRGEGSNENAMAVDEAGLHSSSSEAIHKDPASTLIETTTATLPSNKMQSVTQGGSAAKSEAATSITTTTTTTTQSMLSSPDGDPHLATKSQRVELTGANLQYDANTKEEGSHGNDTLKKTNEEEHQRAIASVVPFGGQHITTQRQIVEPTSTPINAGIESAVKETEQEGPEEYADEDGGVIRCICECDDDDGFTIQCDRCLVWQHCACFGMSQASVPEEYHCEQCNPRPVDIEFAKAHQQKRRDAEARKASLERSIRRHSQANSAAAASFRASMGIDTVQEGGFLEAEGMMESPLKGQQGMGSTGGIVRSRKPSQQLDLTNVSYKTVEGPTSATATPGSSKSYRKRGGGPKTGSRKTPFQETPGASAITPRTAAMMSSMVGTNLTGTAPIGRGDDRMESDESLAERMEAWQVEHTPSNRNLIFDETILTSLTSAMVDFEQGSPLKAERGTGNRIISPVIGKKVKTLSNVAHVMNTEARKSIEREGASSSSSMAVEYGLTPIGNECIPVEMPVSSLADCTQKTYVKQISELASASIFNALLQINTLPSEPQRPWSASRAFSKPIMHGLFADASIPAGCFIAEYTGEICNADLYRRDPVNQYQWTGTSKPNVHLFPPPLNLCIDARRFGNTTRFARFSCHPNTVLRPIVLNPSGEEEDDGSGEAETSQYKLSSPPYITGHSKDSQIHFGLFAIADIPRTHEITLGWEWDDAHVVHLLPQLVRNPMLGIMEPNSTPLIVASISSQRASERERRNAAIAALVEKGDFPYAGTTFSQKMNSILTVLLSSCLCACIGSAAAPTGHGGGSSNSGNSTASSNNVKRQDCAILQMLRLSQGMNLLNVHVPGSNSTGKSNRKSKVPDFEPLVGKRRWWRPDAMPPTPRSSQEADQGDMQVNQDDSCHRTLNVRYKILPGGKVGRVDEVDFESAMDKERNKVMGPQLTADEEGVEEVEEEDDDPSGDDNDKDESRDSEASSLTEALSGRSEEENDDDDEEDDSLVLDENNVTIAREESGATFLTRTALPPKKRVSGTRLKAVCSADERSDVDRNSKKKKQKSKEGRGEVNKKRGLPSAPKDEDYRTDSKNQPSRQEASISKKEKKKKKKHRKRVYEASSPLTSAPSEDDSESDSSGEESNDEISTPIPNRFNQSTKRKAMKRETSNESDAGLSKSKRRKKVDDSDSKRKELMAKRRRRRDLLGDMDMESAASSGEEGAEQRQQQQQQIEKVKERNLSPASMKKKKSMKKKVMRQIMESDDSGSEVDEGTPSTREASTAPVSTNPISFSSVNDYSTQLQAVPEMIQASPPPPPPPVIEVPKAKLSLADYKKRLAERRTSSNVQSNVSTPLSTPTFGPGGFSPDKPSLPNTPTVSSAAQAGIGFPNMSTSFMAVEPVTTPTSFKTEFAPPAPRFPRPTTPPRGTSVLPVRSTSVGSNAVSGNAMDVSTSTTSSSFVPRAPLQSPEKPSFQAAALPPGETFRAATAAASSPIQAAGPPLNIPSSELNISKPPMMTVASSKEQEISADSTTNISRIDSKSARSTTNSSFTPIRPIQESRLSDASLSPSLSTTTRQTRTPSLSTQNYSPPSSTTAINANGGVNFNPPKGPRALINSTFTTSTSTGTPSTISTTHLATSPTLGPVNSSITTVTTSTSSVATDAKHQRQPSSHDVTPPMPSSTKQPTSPTFALTGNANPTTSTLSTTAPTAIAAATAPTSNNASASSINDFANVPKGPARMRERERERERDFREPIPAPRERVWERERDWELHERERERDYLERERSFAAPPPRDNRDREHSMDRRRLEEEDDYQVSRAPHFVSRGGGGRGTFAGGPTRHMAGAWSGRARTRGRGSRGGWR